MSDPSRLTRRPEALAVSVEWLLQMVQEGKLRLPDFQRPQRWRSSHVTSFFDSIYRGIPVGTLLLSRHPAPAAHLRFGPVEVDAPELADSHAIVDGQQRITALAGALLHPDERPLGDIHAIWFDLEREDFKRCVASPPTSWIPLNVVGDSFKQLRWLNDWPARNERPDPAPPLPRIEYATMRWAALSGLPVPPVRLGRVEAATGDPDRRRRCLPDRALRPRAG